MLRKITPTLTLAVAALTLTAMTAAPTAFAAVGPAPDTGHRVTTVARGLVGPLSVAVGRDGTRYFTENFTGVLHAQVPGHKPIVLFRPKVPGTEVAGVSVDGGRVRFVVSGRHEKFQLLKALGPKGNGYTVANLGRFERRRNPDHNTNYGFRNLGKSCADQLPANFPPATYRGQVDSHPYETELEGRTTYVADAGGNDILRVGPGGRISVVAVLPSVKARVTQSAAEANGLPKCTVGKTYRFEGVPTDVERGPDGWFYVSSLPGGPEDGSTGAIGSVVKVNPRTGRVVTVASGLVSANGLAVARNGDVYVSQLFAGVISRIRHGSHNARPFVRIPLPADIDVAPRGLIAVVNVLPPEDGPPDGKVVSIVR